MNFLADYTMTIDGKGVSSECRLAVENPANGETIGAAPDCSRAQLDLAVNAARRAFPAWAATSIDERKAAVKRLGKLVMENVDALSGLLVSEQGKPFSEAKIEVTSLGMLLQAQTKLDIPVHVAEDGPDRIVETHYVPIGVVGAIAPWNFPVLLAGFKIGPSLIAGNTLVLKPSPFTPLTTLKIVELARDVFPAGVFNVVSGGDDLGPWLTSHPDIDKVSFTGSTQTGKRVMESAAKTLKRVTLELGGNDAAIVLPDVDIKAVAEKLFWSAFANNGQICIATKRMYIHKDIYDPLVAALVSYGKTLTIGNGAEQGTRIGPINNQPQYERVLDLIADAKDKGYKFLLGGDADEGPGYFIPVTLIDNPPDDSRIVQEEQFGPVLPLIKYDTIDEVITRANNSEYGLAGSVWAADEDLAISVANRMQTGNVFINYQAYLSPFAPFGGQKQSGLGVEGGVEGLLEYMNSQTLVRRRLPA